MKYHTIVADPPWDTTAGRAFSGYRVIGGKQVFNCPGNASRKLAYPTMTVDEIASLDVQSIAHQNAHLYLWTTNQYLPQAFKVIAAWGFKYSTCITWEKALMGGGLGGAFGINSEFLLFARRGKLPAKCRWKGTVIQAKRPYVNGKPKHSKKPQIFYDMIEKVSPGPYAELFARDDRPGWDVWGNEVKSAAALEQWVNPIPSNPDANPLNDLETAGESDFVDALMEGIEGY